MALAVDMTGKRIGRLTVLERAPRPSKGYEGVCWLCRCDCGNTVIAYGGELRYNDKKAGYPRSCGCAKRNQFAIDKRHYTPEFTLWNNAKRRSRQKHLPFDLAVEDIQIPATCPLLGLPLHWRPDKWDDFTPTLDRKKPMLGYIKGNVWVISFRANLLKSNATIEELERLVNALRNHGIV